MIPITLDNVTFSYASGVQALRDVSLRIAPGESVALIGQNGAGKTTLARHLNGLLRPTAGRVLIGDDDTRQHTVAQMARLVGYVFQHPEHQIFKRSVRDEIAVGPRNLGFDAPTIEALVAEAIAATGLADVVEEHPHDLMPALRKRVTLASVLAMNTPIVVLDEPTTGQDARGMRLIGDVVEHLRAAGRTIVTISHDIDFCADHCPRLIVLRDGAVIADGSRQEVFAHPEILARTAVEPPQIARLAARLRVPLSWQIDPLLDALSTLDHDG